MPGPGNLRTAKGDGSAKEASEPGSAWPAPFLRSLEFFLAVFSEQSFSAAARTLSVSQPTVSQRIQGLESALGLELFHRGNGKVEPTTAGSALAVYAERMIALRDEMLGQLGGLVQLAHGTLRIAASTTPGNYVMPPVLQRFGERHQGLRIIMQIGDSERVLELVRDGAVEVGLVGGIVSDDQFCSEAFIDDEIVVITVPGHPLLSVPKLSFNDLCDYTWVVREPGSGTRRFSEEMLNHAALGRPIRIGMVLDSTEAIKLAVRAGAGIAMVSDRAVENEVALGTLGVARFTDQQLRRRFLLVRSCKRTLSPAAAELWSFLLGASRVNQARR